MPSLHIFLASVMRTLVEHKFFKPAYCLLAAHTEQHDCTCTCSARGHLVSPIRTCPMAAALDSLDAACCSLQQCQSGLDWVVTAQHPNRRRGRQQRLQRGRQYSNLWVAAGVCCLNLKHLQHITSPFTQGGQHLQQS